MNPLSRAVVAASVVGREHLRLGRNNQDGVAVRVTPELIAVAVSDGCSSGRYSEVGARLGAAFLVEHAGRVVERRGGVDAQVAAELADLLLGYLYEVARGLKPGSSGLSGTVADYLLFSFLCAVVDDRQALVFGVGDGVVSVNGQVKVLDAGPDNAPHYLAYRMVGAEVLVQAAPSAPEIHLLAPVAELQTLTVGTDGLIELLERSEEPLKSGERQGGLEVFEQQALYVKNPVAAQRRLTVISEGNRRLRDDTTLVVLRERRD